jgi:hypothetical protein
VFLRRSEEEGCWQFQLAKDEKRENKTDEKGGNTGRQFFKYNSKRPTTKTTEEQYFLVIN